MRRSDLGVTIAVMLVAGACAGSGSGEGTEVGDTTAATETAPNTLPAEASTGTEAVDTNAGPDEQRHPDVVAATATETPDGWTIEATLSSPYDSPERYADAWRALDPDGTILGVRELLHDHAGEQPFTRSLTAVEIPDAVQEITIEGRDLEYGWGGGTVTIELDRAP